MAAAPTLKGYVVGKGEPDLEEIARAAGSLGAHCIKVYSAIHVIYHRNWSVLNSLLGPNKYLDIFQFIFLI